MFDISDGNDKDTRKYKYKDKDEDNDKDKVTKKTNMCHIFENYIT